MLHGIGYLIQSLARPQNSNVKLANLSVNDRVHASIHHMENKAVKKVKLMEQYCFLERP
jgi:hypothetical protein